MNLEILTDVLRNSILITGLVIIMMLLIEYFNIQSKGEWFAKLQGSPSPSLAAKNIINLILVLTLW